ncbi:hypothetical protein BGZ76_005383, partial [Entomortierella beljakovae]
MHPVRGQALPTFFDPNPLPLPKKDSGSSTSKNALGAHSTHDPKDNKEGGKEKHDKHKSDKKKSKDDKPTLSKMLAGTTGVTTAMLGQDKVPGSPTLSPILSRIRSSSNASQRSIKSSSSLNKIENRNSLDNISIHSGHANSGQTSHHHFRLPPIFKRSKPSSPNSPSLESPSSSLQIPSPLHSSQKNQHTILMVPKQYIHITWPHPVPSGNAFIAGTWSVPGHGPWDKLPMTRNPDTDLFEIYLNVQEEEDASDYLDEDGYHHHELLDTHHPHDHTVNEHQSSPTSPPARVSKRQRIAQLFKRRSRSSSNASTTGKSQESHVDMPYHHQSKDDELLPLAREYHYQYKFVIDDEWKTDPDQRHVQDSEGNWNHELVVDLFEQTPMNFSVGSRSRSSSIHSLQSAAQVADVPLNTATTSKVSSDEQDKAESELSRTDIPQISVVQEEETADTNSISASEASQDVRASTTPAEDAPLLEQTSGVSKPKDVYEAVLIFDEENDQSDGEGRNAQPELDDSDNESDEPQQIQTAHVDEAPNEPAAAVITESDKREEVEPIPQVEDHPVIAPLEQEEPQTKDEALPKPFALQEAADPYIHSTTAHYHEKSEEEPKPQITRITRTPLEVVITDSVGSGSNSGGFPSPPLTPSNTITDIDLLDKKESL